MVRGLEPSENMPAPSGTIMIEEGDVVPRSGLRGRQGAKGEYGRIKVGPIQTWTSSTPENTDFSIKSKECLSEMKATMLESQTGSQSKDSS